MSGSVFLQVLQRWVALWGPTLLCTILGITGAAQAVWVGADEPYAWLDPHDAIRAIGGSAVSITCLLVQFSLIRRAGLGVHLVLCGVLGVVSQLAVWGTEAYMYDLEWYADCRDRREPVPDCAYDYWWNGSVPEESVGSCEAEHTQFRRTHAPAVEAQTPLRDDGTH